MTNFRMVYGQRSALGVLIGVMSFAVAIGCGEDVVESDPTPMAAPTVAAQDPAPRPTPVVVPDRTAIPPLGATLQPRQLLPSPNRAALPTRTPGPSPIDTSTGKVLRASAPHGPQPEVSGPTALPNPTQAMVEGAPTPPTVPRAGLDPGCIPGGELTDVVLILLCNELATGQAHSFRFSAEISMAVAFPSAVAAEDVSPVQIEGAVMMPDRSTYRVSLDLGGANQTVTFISIGEFLYTQDPEQGYWIRTSSDEQFMNAVDLLTIHADAQGPQVTLRGVERAAPSEALLYEVVREEADGSLGLLPRAMSRWLIDSTTFLTAEASVDIGDGGDSDGNLGILRVYAYNSIDEITPPRSFLDIPPMGYNPPGIGPIPPSGPSARPGVVDLARNQDGNVQVTFTSPVIVEGSVELYVIDSSTGGWTLPLLHGSGTSVLTFDAAPEGKPALVEGASQIPGMILGTDLALVDQRGAAADVTFDTWTYR